MIDNAKMTRIWPSPPVRGLGLRMRPPVVIRASRSRSWTGRSARRIVASGVTGVNVELTVTLTQSPASHVRVTAAPAMSMQA